jgi:hypothetical protein
MQDNEETLARKESRKVFTSKSTRSSSGIWLLAILVDTIMYTDYTQTDNLKRIHVS